MSFQIGFIDELTKIAGTDVAKHGRFPEARRPVGFTAKEIADMKASATDADHTAPPPPPPKDSSSNTTTLPPEKRKWSTRGKLRTAGAVLGAAGLAYGGYKMYKAIKARKEQRKKNAR